MEGQISYNMFKKGLKLIPQEVHTKVAQTRHRLEAGVL